LSSFPFGFLPFQVFFSAPFPQMIGGLSQSPFFLCARILLLRVSLFMLRGKPAFRAPACSCSCWLQFRRLFTPPPRFPGLGVLLCLWCGFAWPKRPCSGLCMYAPVPRSSFRPQLLFFSPTPRSRWVERFPTRFCADLYVRVPLYI